MMLINGDFEHDGATVIWVGQYLLDGRLPSGITLSTPNIVTLPHVIHHDSIQMQVSLLTILLFSVNFRFVIIELGTHSYITYI